ncbi:MAG: lipid-A-disaccharide synthase N-terminal domain-containing protein [Xanthomonadales bacterium]|nr:lipid-A-disaccharide synthase N-terminal domain-containing protein [Xanthomonadales bacterium]
MNLANPLWFAIGLLAQLAFAGRFLSQWILSERARRSLLPRHFWQLSLCGAVLLLAYASHQRDPVIASGQLLGLAIYLRNLQLLRRAQHEPAGRFLLPWLLLSSGSIAVGLLSHNEPLSALVTRSESNWIVLGFIGQVLFTGRFVVQLYYSERARTSVNPVQFWYLSLSGRVLLLAYALHTRDAIIILGQSFGLVVYLRNLALIRAHHKVTAADQALVPPSPESTPESTEDSSASAEASALR